MYTQSISPDFLTASVIAVPPLARNADLTIDRPQNAKIVRHLEAGGVTTLLYGGNANLYHVGLSEYAGLLDMLLEIAGPKSLVIPSAGPAYGTMMDQAGVLRSYAFPAVMVLPQRDMATPAGVAGGLRRFAERLGRPLVLYLKHEGYLSVAGVQALVRDGLVAWIKYAVPRDDPAQDDWLRQLVDAVGSERIVSGIGEQPALVHLRDFGLAGFTSGCVCLAPRLSTEMLQAMRRGEWSQAEHIQRLFRPLENLRNRIHPVRVLHRAVALAGIAETGPLLPLLSDIEPESEAEVRHAAHKLLALNGA